LSYNRENIRKGGTMSKNRVGIFIIFFLMAVLTACATNPVTGQKELMLVSEGQEIDMGREFYPNALWGDIGGGGELKDEKSRDYLKGIISGIHGVSHRSHLPVQFAVQNSSVPNAWAIPGHVVMTRGLLAELDNEAEFAFVMGHEMGHVSARHSAKQMSYGMLQQIGLGAAGIALSGSEYAEAAMTVGAIGSSLLLLKYSRDDELEADRLGILYMSKLGYDPKNALSAHRNLEKISQEYMRSVGKDPSQSGFFEDLLSTHPRTSVRIEEIQQMITKTPRIPFTGDGTYRERFQTKLTDMKRLNALYRDYYDKAVTALQKKEIDAADSFITQGLNKDQSQPAFHTLKGLVMLKKKEHGESEKYFRTALTIDNNYEPAQRGMGMLRYSEKNYSEALQYLKKSLSLYPQDISSHYFMGMSYYRSKAYRNAIPNLKVFAEAQPKHAEIHGVLGICYEETGEMPSAYEEYVLQTKVAPDNDMGRHASKRATALKPSLEKKKR
jgi:beta-barrel assembly-enhancing protease